VYVNAIAVLYTTSYISLVTVVFRSSSVYWNPKSNLRNLAGFYGCEHSDVSTIISKTGKINRMGLNLDWCLNTKFSYFKW